MTDFTIGGLARAAGVSVETIRFYERRGLITRPLRPKDGGYRRYGRDVANRVRFIRQAQTVGFSLREIAELLAMRTERDGDCAAVEAMARTKLAEIEDKLARLARMKAAIEGLLTACPGRGPLTACSILDAFEARGEGR